MLIVIENLYSTTRILHKTMWLNIGSSGQLSVKFKARGVYPPLSRWCILHIHPYFHKIYKFLPIFVQFVVFCLIYVSLASLF